MRRVSWLMVLVWTALPVRADVASDIQAALARGDASGALARSSAAMKTAEPGARVRFLHGVALLESGRHAEAMNAFVALTQDYPQLPEPYNNIAALHARAGEWGQARQALETALRNDPGNRIARENLGDVYLQLAIGAWREATVPERTEAGLARKIRYATAIVSQIAATGARTASDGR